MKINKNLNIFKLHELTWYIGGSKFTSEKFNISNYLKKVNVEHKLSWYPYSYEDFLVFETDHDEAQFILAMENYNESERY